MSYKFLKSQKNYIHCILTISYQKNWKSTALLPETMASEMVPKDLWYLRAYLLCSLVKTIDQLNMTVVTIMMHTFKWRATKRWYMTAPALFLMELLQWSVQRTAGFPSGSESVTLSPLRISHWSPSPRNHVGAEKSSGLQIQRHSYKDLARCMAASVFPSPPASAYLLLWNQMDRTHPPVLKLSRMLRGQHSVSLAILLSLNYWWGWSGFSQWINRVWIEWGLGCWFSYPQPWACPISQGQDSGVKY